MKRTFIRPVLAVTVVAITVLLFGHYIVNHPESLEPLKKVGPGVLAALFGLYITTLLCLALAQEGILRLCNTKLKHGESFLLVSYTAIINFFGPLQSGPGFRAAYLKKKYGTKLRNYTLASLIYFALFAAFSGVLLLSGLVGWNILAAIGLSAIVIITASLKLDLPVVARLRALRLRAVYVLAIATLLQVLVTAVIYFVELRAVNPSVGFGQALVYTGAANFSLFVSITPAAIGFRESFLLFSQQLHHISSADIISANLLDRGFYVVFLGLLFLLVIGLNAKERFRVRTTDL